MAKELVELIVQVGIQIAEWLTNRKKKKGDCSNDGKRTSETK
jgi:hypothetical protein